MVAINLQDSNATLALARKVVFITATFFSLIVLALSAHITSWTSSFIFGGYYSFAALGIATAILTMLTLPTALWLSQNRKGAVTSKVVVELAWTWFLWIMWLSVGSSAASYNWLGGCGATYGGLYNSWYSGWATACHETRAVTAFGFLTWLLLLAYNIFLAFLTIRQHLRQNTAIWASHVDDANFDAPPVGGQIPPAKMEAQYSGAGVPAAPPVTPYAPQVAQ